MSMPSSKITVTTNSVTDATTTQPKVNTSEKTQSAAKSLIIPHNSGEIVNRSTSPIPTSATSRYQKQARITNPIPSTSKGDILKDEESLDCPTIPRPCTSSCLPLGQAKGYFCSCNPVDDPKPGPSTSAAEFDLEVFDSCSSGSLEDCWGPDCHHSSCETSPVAGSTNRRSVLVRSSGRNKSFHRKGNKRQLSNSGITECKKIVESLNKPGTSSGDFSLKQSNIHGSKYHKKIIHRSRINIGDLSDNSSEEDLIMTSPGRSISTHGKY